jgi:hypothetical protein
LNKDDHGTAGPGGSRTAERYANALPPDNRPGRPVYAALDMPFAAFFDGVQAEAVASLVLIIVATGEGRYRGCRNKAPMGSG